MVTLPADWDQFPSISRMVKVKTLNGLKVQPELNYAWYGVKLVIFSGEITLWVCLQGME